MRLISDHCARAAGERLFQLRRRGPTTWVAGLGVPRLRRCPEPPPSARSMRRARRRERLRLRFRFSPAWNRARPVNPPPPLALAPSRAVLRTTRRARTSESAAKSRLMASFILTPMSRCRRSPVSVIWTRGSILMVSGCVNRLEVRLELRRQLGVPDAPHRLHPPPMRRDGRREPRERSVCLKLSPASPARPPTGVRRAPLRSEAAPAG